MAKFWRAIRQIVQNIPIPGVGISIQDGKDIYQGIKIDPGGTIVYEPPASPTPEADILEGGAYVRKYNLWLWIAIIAAILYYSKKG